MNNCYCESNSHEWADEILLLDDDNTNISHCIKCKNRNLSNGDSTMFIQNGKLDYDDRLESPDDSPLLSPSPILTTDVLHCHYVCLSKKDESSLTKISLAALLCFLFMIAELIGGYFAGSLAIMTDAAHLFADLISFLVSIISIKVGRKPATRSMTFGYARAEVLGAFLSILAVWLLAISFFILAIDRLWTGKYEIEANTMIICASIGLGVNILMAVILHGSCHVHAHENNMENINVRAAFAHVIGDLLQSIGVLLAAIIIKIYPPAKAIDPICTILFTILVIFVTRKVAKDSVIILMETSPKNVTNILIAFKNLPGVKHVHNLHVWSIAPGMDALAAHLAVDNNCDRDTILNQASLISKDKFNIISCTIQIEPYQESIMNECDNCQVLYR